MPNFDLSYLLTGHVDRAKAGLNNIIQMFSKAGVVVSFTPTVRNPDLRIHGANFAKATLNKSVFSHKFRVNENNNQYAAVRAVINA